MCHWCVCGHAHITYSQIKNKSDRISKSVALIFWQLYAVKEMKGNVQHTENLSGILYLCSTWKKSCLHFLWHFVVWQCDGESLIVRLWLRQLISLHADTERCVPAWTGNNCPWLRPYGGASEEQTGTGGNELLWASRNTSPQICWHTPETEPFISPPAHPLIRLFTDADQQNKAKAVCIQMVS